MTVTTTTASQTFQGNGVATAFPCAFEIFLPTDVAVYFVNPATGTQTLAMLNSDYTIVGAGADSGFTVNTTVAVPTGTNLYVVRALSLTQPTDFTNQGAFFPSMHEAAMDRLCMLIQQIANYSEGLNITMAPGLSPPPSSLFPIPQAGSLIGWNEAGDGIVNVGASGVGAGSIADVNIASGAGIQASKLSFINASAGAIIESVQTKLAQQVHVADFGAVGDGVTNDLDALQNALAAVASGGTLHFGNGKNYFIGTQSANYGGNTTAALQLIGVSGAEIHGHGASITSTTLTSGVQELPAIIGLENCTGIWIHDLNVLENAIQSNPNAPTFGACAVRIVASTSTQGAYNNITVERVSQTNGIAVVIVAPAINAPSATDRIYGLSVRDCSTFGAYYGVCLENNSDHTRISGLRCSNYARALFLYGVEDVDADVTGIRAASGGLGSNSSIDIASYGRPTFSIHVRMRSFGPPATVGFNQLAATLGADNGSINDVGVALDLCDTPSGAADVVPFQFVAYDTSGTMASTASSWDNIRLESTYNGIGTPMGANPILEFVSAPTTPCNVHVSSLQAPSASASLQANLANVTFHTPDGFSAAYLTGAAVVAPYTIPAAVVENVFDYEVDVLAVSNYGAGPVYYPSSHYSYDVYLSGTTAGVLTATPKVRASSFINQDAAPTITATSAGISVTPATGSQYSEAGAAAVVKWRKLNQYLPWPR